MNWINFETEKPTESDYYFVKGKGGRKACIYYCVNSKAWEYGALASNHFNDQYISWLKE